VVYCDILSMAPTHDFVKGQTGFDKLVVFVDSLTRWIEAQPVNGDPSSEQILSTFMEMVVSRHGMPRTLRTDRGSNLTAKLCQIVLSKTGTDLSSTEAYRHEGVGLVERAQQTLTAMVCASNEGGSHWVDHLPFLLMAMRATGGRVTKQSPAALLYGRELRLPSQLIDPRVPASVEFTKSMSDGPKAYRQYVEQLNAHLRLAWLTALEATQDAQEESALGTARKTNTDVTFKGGDRVVAAFLAIPTSCNSSIPDHIAFWKFSQTAVTNSGTWRIAWSMMKCTSPTCDRITLSQTQIRWKTMNTSWKSF
jgi:hypothetical protein